MREKLAWIADLRRQHRPETVLTLLQLQVLGPGLYTGDELQQWLGLSERAIIQSFFRLQATGLVQYEGWQRKGRLIWWIADWNAAPPDPLAQFPRWVLRANAAHRVEVLLGKEGEAAKRFGVDKRSLQNFLGRRTSHHRLLGRWQVQLDPVQFVTQ